MERYELDILGISKCRWTSAGTQVTSKGSIILYSGHPEHHEHGVVIILYKARVKTLLEWEPIHQWNANESLLQLKTLNLPAYSVTHQLMKLRRRSKTTDMMSYKLLFWKSYNMMCYWSWVIWTWKLVLTTLTLKELWGNTAVEWWMTMAGASLISA